MDHQAIRYQCQAVADVPASECSPRPIVDGTDYSVVCSACRGHFTVREVNGTFRAPIFKKQPPRKSPPISVACECGFDHSGRPTDDPFGGCGAVWKLIR